METANERRKRKLAELVVRHGLDAIASKADVSKASLDQILKGTLLPRKQDGTRSPRSLGDAAAAAIETALELGAGWFDATDDIAFDADTIEFAKLYQRLNIQERQKMRLLYHVARDAGKPSERWRAPTADASQPADLMIGGDSGLGELQDVAEPSVKGAKK